jgi:DHA2 family multidrug resistance protein
MNAAAAAGGEVENKALLTGSIMLAALMQSLDTTIANVALPHIQGSVSASQDQITWVLTSYIVAAAIMTPLTGWLAQRFGIKNVFLFSIAGFTAASALCGAAQSLEQIVLFRLLQGIAGAALMPLTQAVLFSINPPEKYGSAMATFGLAVMLGPILGPVLGGWLTDSYTWRWVFYINLPLGAVAFMGLVLFMPSRPHPNPSRFDFFGFATLGLFIGALQLMLDRGQQNDWFQSTETWIEMAVSVTSLYLFLVHFFTAQRPFFSKALFHDRNFVATTIAAFFIMSVLFAVMALVPPMLQQFYGYPVVTAGLVTMPRGLGVMLMMPIVGKVMTKIDPRWIIGLGLVLCAHSFWAMSKFTLVMGSWPFLWTGFEQGMAMGCVFVPMSAIGFGTLHGSLRVEGTTVYNLARNIGGSIGISAITSIFVQNIQRIHSHLSGDVTSGAEGLRHYGGAAAAHSVTAMAQLNSMVTRQATMIAYLNDFWLMAIVMIALLPIIFLMRGPRRGAAPPPHMVE